MASVARWTGREAKALRRALRQSVRDFAAALGIGVRTVTKWESLGADTTAKEEAEAIAAETAENQQTALSLRVPASFDG